MAVTTLVLCLTFGLTRVTLGQVRSTYGHPIPIPADGTPMPTDCTEDGTPDYPNSGSFRPHIGSIEHPASCSRFWRCNTPEDGKVTLYECPPCPPELPECKGNPLLVFDINTKSCKLPSNVTEFFVSGECDCNKCITKQCNPSNGASCYPWGEIPNRAGPNMIWCEYCDGEVEDCVYGCLYDVQCAVGLICKDHKCVVPPCVDPTPEPECECNEPDSCPACSTCQATVSWKCSDPPTCCPDKPCPSKCEDCIDGDCKRKECGACNECDEDTGECIPIQCDPCEECNMETEQCESCCGPCTICDEENDECIPEECGPCKKCNPDSDNRDKCEDVECGPCEDCNTETDQCESECETCFRCNTDSEKCEPLDCGKCSSCNTDTDQCEPITCNKPCHECNIESDICEPNCGPCTICDVAKDECIPEECGPCKKCNPDSDKKDKCEDVKCGPCEDCNTETDQCESECKPCFRCNTDSEKCEPLDCGNCSICNTDTDQCEPETCPKPCEECNIESGKCEDCCGTCSECNTEKDQCEPKACEKCEKCNMENGECEDRTCGVCTVCDDETDECKPIQCEPCHQCSLETGKCEEIDCGPCGECNADTNKCEGDQDKCKPECGVPHCEECVGVPGKNEFVCQDFCANSTECEGCCCIDDDCKTFCKEDQYPMCDCENHKCQCHNLGNIVVKNIEICTIKCEGCDALDRSENMILNLVGEEFLWGKPECTTAKIDVPIKEGECRTIGVGLDEDICGGCYKYPLGGDIDEDSTVDWLNKGTWSGSFCVSWLPEDNMYVKCDVEDGEVTDCDEVCDCHDETRTVCPDKKSAKSRKSSGILGWFK